MTKKENTTDQKIVERYQSAREDLKRKLNTLSLTEIGLSLFNDESDLKEIKSKVLTERLLNGEKIYDIGLLRNVIYQLTLDDIYRLAKNKNEKYISFLAKETINTILDETFETMNWQKEGEEDDQKVSNYSSNHKIVGIKEFITGGLTPDSNEWLVIKRGKITHTLFQGYIKRYGLSFSPVLNADHQMKREYAADLVIVQDEQGEKRTYYDLTDYLQQENYQTTKEETSYSLEHQNRGHHKRQVKYKSKGIQYKGVI